MTLCSDRAAARQTLLTRAGWGDALARPLAGDASFRRYERLTLASGDTAVLMDAPPPHEDTRPFVSVAEHLTALGYSAPRILAADIETGFLLLEDLGDATYTRLLAAGAPEEPLYTLAVDTLADLHARFDTPASGLAPYDASRLRAEARLFVEWTLPALGRPVSPAASAAFDALWPDLATVARAVPATLVLRDFHVDNLLRLERPGVRACGLLDFQDALWGPVTYDLMSLLEDARRDIAPDLLQKLRARYLAAHPELDPQAFLASWAVLAAQRHLKVLGIFTRLDRRDGKPTYLSHMPRLWRLLDAALAHPVLAPLASWLERHGAPAGERDVAPQSPHPAA
ncbi:aminoglycoside phosphotransferase family protein [Pararhodospirillum photometricum]|uniref:Aminoglycoside phosphotransferase n=1 Tax=Pararhodospirillum photometricum DSM 122 TaxID=1150469 RepID=H6SMX8_PARPM|nr:phosphotransferase [Pararhodospirillum photometricum]CCG06854.1 Aminoglycoside phosphotransferase [Pararhodospirillum photometricum DSM 122]